MLISQSISQKLAVKSIYFLTSKSSQKVFIYSINQPTIMEPDFDYHSGKSSSSLDTSSKKSSHDSSDSKKPQENKPKTINNTQNSGKSELFASFVKQEEKNYDIIEQISLQKLEQIKQKKDLLKSSVQLPNVGFLKKKEPAKETPQQRDLKVSFMSQSCNYVRQIKMSAYKIKKFEIHEKYLRQFWQFGLEILSDLSWSENGILSMTFNPCRFLMINLTPFFVLQLEQKILSQLQMLESDNQFSKFFSLNVLKENNQRTRSKFFDAIQLAKTKITGYLLRYQEAIKNQQNVQTNQRKMQLIFDSNPELKQLFFRLNNPDYVNRIKDYDMEYDWGLTKQIYYQMVSLLTKQIFHIKVIERAFKKCSKQYQSLVEKYDLNFQQITQIQQNFKLNSEEDFYQYKSLAINFTAYVMEAMKIFGMILSLPFYSMENKRSYQRKRAHDNANQHQIIESIERKKDWIFQKLDQFYIYNRARLTPQALIRKLKQKQSQSFHFDYKRLFINLSSFIKETSFDEKEKIISLDSIFSLIPKPKQTQLHSERASIFDQDECFQFIYPLHTMISLGPQSFKNTFKQACEKKEIIKKLFKEEMKQSAKIKEEGVKEVLIKKNSEGKSKQELRQSKLSGKMSKMKVDDQIHGLGFMQFVEEFEKVFEGLPLVESSSRRNFIKETNE